MRLGRMLLALAAPVVLASCGIQQAVGDAAKEITTFHSELDGQEYDMIWANAAPELHSAATNEQFEKLLEAIHRKLGNVKQSSQVGWKENATTNGTFVEVQMDTTFEKGSGHESFTYIQHDKHLQLMGYFINSNDMMVN